jgi:hypothetical protein
VEVATVGAASTREPIAQELDSTEAKAREAGQSPWLVQWRIVPRHEPPCQIGPSEEKGLGPLLFRVVARIAEKQGQKDAALEYGERAYRGCQALGGHDRAMAEPTRAIRFAKELGFREEAERLGAELTSEERRLGPTR